MQQVGTAPRAVLLFSLRLAVGSLRWRVRGKHAALGRDGPPSRPFDAGDSNLIRLNGGLGEPRPTQGTLTPIPVSGLPLGPSPCPRVTCHLAPLEGVAFAGKVGTASRHRSPADRMTASMADDWIDDCIESLVIIHRIPAASPRCLGSIQSSIQSSTQPSMQSSTQPSMQSSTQPTQYSILSSQLTFRETHSNY